MTLENSNDIISAIRAIHPGARQIVSVRHSSSELYDLDVTLADGAMWQVGIDTMLARPIAILRVIGIGLEGRALTPAIAANYCPLETSVESRYIPYVDCGAGYRQLEWNEPIRASDEYYDLKDNSWMPCIGVESVYRPRHSSAAHGVLALTRRKLES